MRLKLLFNNCNKVLNINSVVRFFSICIRILLYKRVIKENKTVFIIHCKCDIQQY